MLSSEELQRYQRHLVLQGFGREGQERLKMGRVLVVGAGGLGCPALLYLAAAGVGRIVLIDSDRVDESNLQRQVLYRTGDTGRPKAEIAAERLRALNPTIEVVGVAERFHRGNALALVRASDVVIDGSDNFATRYLVNDACVMADRPFVYGAIQGFEGQLSVFNWQGGPTYRCLFPAAPPADLAPSCADAGVLGVVPGLIGTAQACEAIKLLTGVGRPLSGKLLLWNALSMSVQTVALAADPRSRPIHALPEEVAPVCAGVALETDVVELRGLLARGAVQLLDVRETWERELDAIEPSLHVPLAVLEDTEPHEAIEGLRVDVRTVVYCAVGVRSLHAVHILRSRLGLANATSLRGGLQAWRAPR